MDINTGWAREFQIALNEPLLASSLDRAKTIWRSMQEGTELEGECGHLCAYCPFKGQCQTLRNGATELPTEIAEKVNRLQLLSRAEKEIKAIKADVKSYLEAAELKKATAGANTVILVSCKGKPTINAEKLKELAGDDVVAECSVEGDAYSYLRVA